MHSSKGRFEALSSNLRINNGLLEEVNYDLFSNADEINKTKETEFCLLLLLKGGMEWESNQY